jgi:hypothetical protein
LRCSPAFPVDECLWAGTWTPCSCDLSCLFAQRLKHQRNSSAHFCPIYLIIPHRMSSLPVGWEERHVLGPNGRRYYVTPGPLRGTTWVDPLLPINENHPLPRGWDCRLDRSVRWYYFNRHHMTITYEDPRLPQSGKFSPIRLQRGHVPSDIWFYGDIPPTAASISDEPPAYLLSPLGPPVAFVASSQLTTIHQNPPARSDVTLPGIESLSLPQCRAQTEFQSRNNSQTIADASDDDRAPHPQICSNDSHSVSSARTESNRNLRTPESEQESANTQPTSESKPKNNDDAEWLETFPKNEDFSLSRGHILAASPTRNQRRRERRKLEAKSTLMSDGDNDSVAVTLKTKACKTGIASIPAKDPTPTQSRRARRKVKKLLGKSAAAGASTTRTSEVKQLSNPGRDTEPSPQPEISTEPAPGHSLPRYRLVRAYGSPSGAVLYFLLAATCVAEEVAPHYSCLTWYTGGLHHHAAVNSHPDHVRTSENKLDSFHRGLENFLDADYLIIEFPDRIEHGREAVNYTNEWADLYRGRTFEDAIRIGRVVKMPCPEGCTLGPISLRDQSHASVDKERRPTTPPSIMEANTRTTPEEAGLFERKPPQVRLSEEPAGAGSPSIAQTGSSAGEDGLLDRMITRAMPMLRRLLPNWEAEDLRCRLGEALRRLVCSLSHP